MWTPAARAQLARAATPYASCLTDAEWALAEPLLPPPAPRGRPRRWPMRFLLDAILYVLRTGCAWRHLPRDFPPWQTVLRWFLRLARSGAFERMAHALAVADCKRAGRGASPTAAVVDAQAARSGGVGVAGRRGYDAAKRVIGRKRHALVDTDGRLLLGAVSPADLARQPRWYRPAEDLAPSLALRRAVLRGSRLRRTARRRGHAGPHRTCRSEARPEGLRRAAAEVGDRVYLRLDRALPPPRARPRSHAKLRDRLLRPRRRDHPAQEAGETDMKRVLSRPRSRVLRP
jgi:transposase